MAYLTEIQSPGLPKGIHRDAIMQMIERLAGTMKLPHRAVAYLRIITRHTANADWYEQGAGPRCFTHQGDLAEIAGFSRSTANRAERVLEEKGLIKIRRLSNNHRSGKSGRIGQTGIFLAPLIGKYQHLTEMYDEVNAQAEKLKMARRDVSILKAELRKEIRISDRDRPGLEEARTVYDSTPERPSQITSMDELDRLAKYLRKAIDTFMAPVENTSRNDNLTHENSDSDTPHIQITLKNNSVICNDNHIISISSSPKTNAHNKFSKESSVVGKNIPNIKRDANNISYHDMLKSAQASKIEPRILRSAASNEFQFYVDARTNGGRISFADLVFAADMRRRDLGIRDAAWSAAQTTMGEIDRAVAVMILDKNQDHPIKPVRNPGGALMGMVKKARRDELHLVASIAGIIDRQQQ